MFFTFNWSIVTSCYAIDIFLTEKSLYLDKNTRGKCIRWIRFTNAVFYKNYYHSTKYCKQKAKNKECQCPYHTLGRVWFIKRAERNSCTLVYKLTNAIQKQENDDHPTLTQWDMKPNIIIWTPMRVHSNLVASTWATPTEYMKSICTSPWHCNSVHVGKLTSKYLDSNIDPPIPGIAIKLRRFITHVVPAHTEKENKRSNQYYEKYVDQVNTLEESTIQPVE